MCCIKHEAMLGDIKAERSLFAVCEGNICTTSYTSF